MNISLVHIFRVMPELSGRQDAIQGIDLHAGKIYFRSQKIYLTGFTGLTGWFAGPLRKSSPKHASALTGKNGMTKSHMGNYFPFSGIKSVVLKK